MGENKKRGSLSVTVVICSHNRPILLERCLKALGQIDHSDFSVVVDSAPSPCAAEVVVTRPHYQVSLIRDLSRARNAGVSAASRHCYLFRRRYDPLF